MVCRKNVVIDLLAVKELNLSYYIGVTISITILYTHYGN